jgi:arylsulfatase A-like enzyme
MMTKTNWMTTVFGFLLIQLIQARAPNILWIYVDDMNDWFGCYGHSLVATPNVDSLAREGVLFEKAYVPSPVCSTTRSALITGTMPTTWGWHDHRKMIKKPIPKNLVTVPELFSKAGYLTFNAAKEDYNFTHADRVLYTHRFQKKSHFDGDLTWFSQLKNRPFFGQIHLAGGKKGGETGSRYPSQSRVGKMEVRVPSYYPDHPVIRDGIARHYEQVATVDQEVGEIISALKKNGLWDQTIIFFFTDHGSPMPREKQNLYEEGLKIPLIVRGPGISPQRREDLVSGIDISVASLSLAGIKVPAVMEGRSLFSTNHQPRSFVIGVRDRLGVAIDRVRCVRTERFRYIRNYYTDRPLYQLQYRESYASLKTLRDLYATERLSPLQASYHQENQRPPEELYDLSNDPDQVKNLAGDPKYAEELKSHRVILNDWIQDTGDQGQFPAAPEELRAVFESANGQVSNPEYDFITK